ncbi:MAG: GumC family protein [Nitrospiraceae bacterium]
MNTQTRIQGAEPTVGIADLLAVLRRRRTLMIGAGSLVFSLGLALAFLWPPSYKSTATILIEEQEIPAEFVHSTITSYADQRIEVIKQQVISRTTLWKIVEQYNLYADMRRRSSVEDVIKQFTDDIKVEVISADVIDRRTQMSTKATIAFTVSYFGGSAETAQKVCNELTSLFLAENLRTRERQAAEATTFLQQEAVTLAKHIEEVEANISKFKQRANGALPELMAFNLQLMNQTDRELMEADQQIRSLEERQTYLEGELSTIKPNTPILSVTGERILDSQERLKTLRAEYASLSGHLASDHPDVIKMKLEIDALEKDTKQGPDADEISKQLVDARATYATLSERLTDDHPDVIKIRQTVTSLENEARRVGQYPRSKSTQPPENPTYINMQAQLKSVTSSLEALRNTRATLKRRLADYSQRIERTPEMEPDYLALARDRDTSMQKYQDIRSRLLEAKVSEGLEVQRKGERFSLLDPPSLPENPERPNRRAIALLGFVVALASGVGGAALAENLDHAVYSSEQLARVTHMVPLAVIPYMPNKADVRRALTRRKILRMTGVGAVATVLALAHLFWLPLDVVWFAVLRKIGLN